MAAGQIIEDAVNELTAQVMEARKTASKMVTVESYSLLAVLAAYGSLLIANGMLIQQNQHLRGEPDELPEA